MVSLKKKGQSGFTIVELLIVIVIIGILAGLVITQVIGATAKARDTERKTDLDQIANQLEVYYARNGFYPTLLNVNNNLPGTANTWRTGNNFSAGDAAKSLADPSNTSVTTLSGTAPNAVGGAYSYVPSPASCTPGTDAAGGSIGSATPCTGYTLTAYLESPAGAYTKTNASN